MRKTNIYLLALLIAIGASCRKKKYPDSTISGEPIFYFTGRIDNNMVQLKAGLDNYYMYSSYNQNVNNVYEFTSAIKTEHCSSCLNSIEFTINDYRTNANNYPAIPDSAFYLGYYPYSIGAVGYKYYSVQLVGNTNKSGAKWNWVFGDGQTGLTQYPLHTFRLGKYYTYATATDTATNCSSTIMNPLKFGIPGANCRTSISASSSSATILFNQATGGGVGGYGYTWSFGDNTGQVFTPTPIHNYAAAGVYSVSLRAIDNNPQGPDTAYANFNSITQGFPSCIANFKIAPTSTSIIPVNNPFRYSNIVIKWTDSKGNIYSSDNSNQPNTSYFIVTSVDDYVVNENMQKTKKLHVKFKCMVYCPTSTQQPSLMIDGAEAIITVAYN